MLSFVSQCQHWLEESQAAMDYLVELRHMTPSSIKSSMIGYFPKDVRLVTDPSDPVELHGLRGRIVIPIFSEFGKVVGIAGRIPDPNEKGWWNTRFSKGSHLYGFNFARKAIFDQNKVYVFEGYFDRAIIAQYGLDNCVAAMSTDLGIRRIGLLSRYCNRICLCFDTDHNDAGLLGTFRTLADMYSFGIGHAPGIGTPDASWEVTMIQLPVKVDPDDFVAEHGMEAFLALEKPVDESKLMKARSAFEELKSRMKERQKREKK